MKVLQVSARSLVILTLLSSLLGCGSRGFTRPRSDLMADAVESGMRLPSPDEDRAVFKKYEDTQKARLLALIKRRTSSDYRDPTYRVGPGDEIEINVFDVPELNVTARVRESQYVSLPLIGAMKAGGLTEAELHDELEVRLRDFVRNPQVSVFISNYGSQKVGVLGAVQKPGSYPLKKGTNSILELIGEAGGVNSAAGSYVNFVPAEISGLDSRKDLESRAQLSLSSSKAADPTRNGIELYLDQVMGTSGGIPVEIPVRGGDMVIVPESGQVMVDGEVEKRGSYELGRQMTLLGALAAAGGITYGAKVNEVEVIREFVGGRKAGLVVDLEKIARGEDRDVRLKSGDLVRVPSDSTRRLEQDTYEGITRIINFGVGGQVNLMK